MKWISKIKKHVYRWTHKPVVVVAFHQVSDQLDPRFENLYDWNSITAFKEAMDMFKKRGYRFVSLPEAQTILQKKGWRLHRYVAVTFDDAWRSILNVRECLLNNNIPFTVFVNSAWMDSELPEDKMRFLNREEIYTLYNHPLISIGLHGHEHLNSCNLSLEQFQTNVTRNRDALKDHPHLIPFFAFPYSAGTIDEQEWLRSEGLVPCNCAFRLNYRDTGVINRCGLGGMNILGQKEFWR